MDAARHQYSNGAAAIAQRAGINLPDRFRVIDWGVSKIFGNVGQIANLSYRAA